jgi:glutamyl-Q tRNA(Asp) synthetase
VATAGIIGAEGAVYPGYCRDKGHNPERESKALRAKTWPGSLEFTDLIHGPVKQELHTAIGDFIIRRTDGLTAYQLAVVVDDAHQQITRVVRGSDLLSSTPRQIHLQGQLALPTMEYAHLPLVLDEQGNKLSKQSMALPVDSKHPIPALLGALAILGQTTPETSMPLPDLWAWALRNWDLSRIPA